MGVGVTKSEYDQHVRNSESVMTQISNNLENLRTEHQQSTAETKRIVKELHDQVYGMYQEIAKLPLQMKEQIMIGIDAKYSPKEQTDIVKNIVFGSIKAVVGAFFLIVFGVLAYALTRGWVNL